jgi:hypothetical protein
LTLIVLKKFTKYLDLGSRVVQIGKFAQLRNLTVKHDLDEITKTG